MVSMKVSTCRGFPVFQTQAASIGVPTPVCPTRVWVCRGSQLAPDFETLGRHSQAPLDSHTPFVQGAMGIPHPRWLRVRQDFGAHLRIVSPLQEVTGGRRRLALGQRPEKADLLGKFSQNCCFVIKLKRLAGGRK